MLKKVKLTHVTWLVLLVIAVAFTIIVTGFIVFPQKYKLPLILGVAVVVLLAGVLSHLLRHKGKLIPIIINVLLSIAMLIGCIYIPILEKKMKDVFSEPDDSGLVRINAYVLTKDYAKKLTERTIITGDYLEDYADATFITQKALDQDNQQFAVEKIEEVLGKVVKTVEKEDVLTAVHALYEGEAEVLILNEIYVNMIIGVPGFEDFERETRVLFSAGRKGSFDPLVIDPYEGGTEMEGGTRTAVVGRPNLDYTKDPFVLYISGNDTRGSALLRYGRNDVNLIAAVNPVAHQIILVSIPRDLYVENPALGYGMDKLTHLGNNGFVNIMTELSLLFGIPVDHYFSVNFSTFQRIVDAVGGVDVDNPYTFSSSYYTFPAGQIHLDGERGLAYVRDRYHLATGDFGRSEHQAIFLQGFINKLTSTEIISNFQGILNAVNGLFLTDMASTSIYSIAARQLETGGGWTMIRYAMTGTGDYQPTASMGANWPLYVAHPIQAQVDFINAEINKLLKGETVTQGTIPSQD